MEQMVPLISYTAAAFFSFFFFFFDDTWIGSFTIEV